MTLKTKRLRELFFSKEIFILPGVVDAYEAKICEAAGFNACYMSGGRTSAARGYPDAGFITMNEMVANAHYIATALGIPILSDADTGYGNALAVRRTVQEFISAGVGGIHLEDQVSPKRCGYMPGKQVVEMEEVVGKLRAAVDVRNELDPDFLIIARTDALGAVGGTADEAIRRAAAYRKVGADVSFLEGVKDAEELRYVTSRVEGPILFIPGGLPEDERPTEEELQKMGVSCALYPGVITDLTTPLLWEYLHDVCARKGAAHKEWLQWLRGLPRKYPAAPSFFQISGFAQVKEWEEKYLSAGEMEKYQKSTGIAYGKGIV
ncbi:MAG: isocitrate lyase/PEP mutase family protein [Chloroflexota bacterium]